MNNEENREDRQVNTYDPNTLYNKSPKKPSGGNWKKGLIIFLIIAVVVVGLGVACNSGAKKVNEIFFGTQNDDYEFSSDYIGVLGIQGTISENSDSTGTYNQKWLIERIEEMKNDPFNKGVILRINTPGGSVYATDQLYLKIEEYKKYTGRPVYTYMESQATSGGYYLAMGSDKIFADRNCWTGSIGVTIGTIYDLSGLLEKMGVKSVTITSGDNKAMGSMAEPMTKEQKQIFQGLVDDAYEQFVGVVADGRDMKKAKVKTLADGRIYTAKQAKANDLIDEISTLDEAVEAMQKDFELESCDIENIDYEPDYGFASWLTGLSKSKDEATTEVEQVKALMEQNNKFTVTYLSNAKK